MLGAILIEYVVLSGFVLAARSKVVLFLEVLKLNATITILYHSLPSKLLWALISGLLPYTLGAYCA